MYSYLYTPALKLDALVRNPATNANMIVVDLEDATHVHKKEAARHKAKAFNFKPLLDLGIKIGVRVNNLSSIDGLLDVLLLQDMYLSGNTAFEYVFLPKVNHARDLEIYRSFFADSPFQPKIYTFIETVEAVENANEIAKLSDALCFGQADLVAQMYAPNQAYVDYARAKLCIAAAKNNLMAIDTNSFEINDMNVFKCESRVE